MTTSEGVTIPSTSLSSDQEYRQSLYSYMIANDRLPSYQADLHTVLTMSPTTDVGNALRIYARYGLNVRYVVDWGVWLIWNGRIWKKDEGDIIIMSYAKTMTGFIMEEARAIAPLPLTEEQVSQLAEGTITARETADKKAKELFKWSHTSQSKIRLEAAIELLKSEPHISILAEQLDANDILLNFPNGTLNLRTMDFCPPDRNDLITKSAGVPYNATADCTIWNKFMCKIASYRPDQYSPYIARPELERYIRALAGMGLYGQVLDQILAIFHGVGGNGKSVWVEMIKEVMGDYAATATSDLFTAKQNEGINNDIARLVGVRFLSASETSEGKFLDEALVKGLTGSERRTARFLRKEFFEFTPKFTPVLLTNYPPVIRGTDSGIWRRLKLIPWDYDFMSDPEREDTPAVMSKLRSEAAGIMNWLIAGLQDRLQLRSIEEIEPEIVRNATNRYREDSDILGQFISECMLERPGESITKEELYKAYSSHAKDSGNNPYSKKTLGTKLQLRGWKERRGTGGVRLWLGWRLRTIDDMDAETAAEPEPETVEAF